MELVKTDPEAPAAETAPQPDTEATTPGMPAPVEPEVHGEPPADPAPAVTDPEAPAAGATASSSETSPAVAGPGAPPAQAGDEPEVAVPVAKPQLLPTMEEGKAELEANPARTSVVTRDGIVVRE